MAWRSGALWLAAACSALLLSGCFNSGNGADSTPEPSGGITVELVVEGLEHPWSLAFLPDDNSRALITERPGRLLLVDLNTGDTHVIGGEIPDVAARGQGGLLDVVLHPDYPNYPWVYLSYAAAGEGGYATHVARAELDTDGLELRQLETLLVAEPFTTGTGHFGSRMVFGTDGLLYITVGDRRNRDSAQDLGSHHGKTLRLEPDGSIPEDNPFTDAADIPHAIYSYGHRNPQGMALHPETTRIWINEHGEQAGDEVNILESGGNFGWPIATYGREYGSGAPIGELPPDNPDTVDPVHYWDEAAFPPSGMAFYFHDGFPEWNGSVFIGGLGRRYLARFPLNGERLGQEERLLQDRNWRIRDVRVRPDNGHVYVLVDAASAPLVRLVPEE
ncbi:MAG: PQQ-dependent sugar dehydrogenase [Ectothiorhodospiraceae bacterium]|nr:PQQ-dependent sugar dehydrogenase [Ectothiorhodospiraceae bacterium]